MRKIDKDMLAACIARVPMSQGNTVVQIDEGKACVYLHGHPIAVVGQNHLLIDWCGWITTTTRSRLATLVHYFRPGYGLRLEGLRTGLPRAYLTRPGQPETCMPVVGVTTL
jgi:hypothetical protein